jgi:hypothetical protein
MHRCAKKKRTEEAKEEAERLARRRSYKTLYIPNLKMFVIM